MKRKFNRVAVLMGGPSAEHDISMQSGRAIAEALKQCGYDVTEIVVETEQLLIPEAIEAVFIAFHGTFGEDGTAQKQLEERGIPYTGSGPEASRISFDKELSKALFRSHHLPQPADQIITEPSQRTIDFPCVIKPLRQGSSLGVHILMDKNNWETAFADAIQYDGRVIVEEYIDGHELTVGVVDGQVLPVIEIVAPSGNYDFTAKYTKGKTSYIVPAKIPDKWRDTCQKLALKVYQALGCRGMSRVDFRVRSDGSIYILENNTIPGFTATSLLPKAAAAAGIPFPELCSRIMQTAQSTVLRRSNQCNIV